jgi:molybdate transport system regulatory protein
MESSKGSRPGKGRTKTREKRPRIRILIGSATALGPGKVDLLEAIAEKGSISAAARAMGMSYRRAWLLMDTMNASFKKPLVDTATGGRGGGGARITPLGREILERYRDMEQKAEDAVSQEICDFTKLMAGAKKAEKR